MNSTISSRFIRPVAIAFAVLWIPGFGLFSVFALMSGAIIQTPGIIAMPIAWVIVTPLLLALILNWTTVVLTDDGLQVTKRKRTICVPFSNIADVTGGWHSGSPDGLVIVIQLRHPTALGSRISFRPCLDARFKANQPHPLVQELKSRAEAQQTPPAYPEGPADVPSGSAET